MFELQKIRIAEIRIVKIFVRRFSRDLRILSERKFKELSVYHVEYWSNQTNFVICKIILRAREAKRIAREAKDNIMEAQQCNVPKENVSANPEEGNVDKTDDGKKENASKTRPDNDGASLLSLEAAKPSSNEGNKGRLF